ncbi:MAG: indolepyruvate oxidoreductase subunit beta [Chloroflexi bacterium]|nr:indolepyruvate oxidoreductase subunit beta [Chloroflexota bacterium]
MNTTNLIFAGVGGQGVLLIAELTARAAVRAGFDVKQTEVHGVSQRGGSVESHVRFGPVVYSPLVTAGQADVVVGLEKLEGLRYANFVNLQCGSLLVNDHEIIPGSVAGAAEKYPHYAIEFLRGKGLKVTAIPASRWAKDLGDGRVANMIMLGAMSALTPQMSEEVWLATLTERIPEKYRALNLKAFETGRSFASPLASPLPAEAGSDPKDLSKN